MSALFDPGLQLERTLLSWRRTCLALALALAVAVRYSGIVEVRDAFVIGVPALAAVANAYSATALRYRAMYSSLSGGKGPLASAGGAVTAVSAVGFLLGCAALAFVAHV